MNELSMKREIVAELLQRHILISRELLENLSDPVYLKWSYETFCQSDFITITVRKDNQVRVWKWDGKIQNKH